MSGLFENVERAIEQSKRIRCAAARGATRPYQCFAVGPSYQRKTTWVVVNRRDQRVYKRCVLGCISLQQNIDAEQRQRLSIAGELPNAGDRSRVVNRDEGLVPLFPFVCDLGCEIVMHERKNGR